MKKTDMLLFNDLLIKAGLDRLEENKIQRQRNKKSTPLSFSQERIWFMDNLVPDSSLFNIPLSIRLTGNLNVATLELSLNKIINRHDILRTRIMTANGIAKQTVLTVAPLRLPVLDLQNDEGETQDKKCRHAVLDASSKPFRLEEDQLFRALLIKLSENRNVLVIVMHHIISDGWSFGIFFNELGLIYNALILDEPIPLNELSVQYSDYVLWQRENAKYNKMQETLDFWNKQLKDIQPLELVTDRSRPSVQKYSGLHHLFTLPAKLSAKIVKLAKEQQVTIFSTLLSAFSVLLYRYSGQKDICVGSPVAGRNPSEIETNIGCFINNIVLRTKLDQTMNFIDLMKAVNQVNVDAQSHQEIPFELLVSELEPDRDLSRSPLFQVMFILQTMPLKATELIDVKMEFEEIENKSSKYDLTLSMEERQNKITGWFEYNTDLFNKSTIIRLAEHYVKLLESTIHNPYEPIAKVQLLPDPEKKKITVEWNDTAKAYTPFQTVHKIIEEQVDKTPDATALIIDDQKLSYLQLSRKTNQLARYLQKKGVKKEIPVAILLERSVEMTLAIHGIGKAGGAYVPIDPDLPKNRILDIIDDVAPAVIITMQKFRPILEGAQANLIIAEQLLDIIAAESADRPECQVGPDNMVYIIYTSGSTGKPKGTINIHKGLHNRLMWMQETFKLDSGDRVLQKTPYSFDVSVWEFFWPFMFGATLVVAKPEGHKDPSYLASLISEKRVTTIHFVPTMLQAFLEAPDIRNNCKSLKRVICSGEALSPSLQKNFFTMLNTDLYNLYGPTEASIDVTCWKCHEDKEMNVVPIGKPISNTQIYILDENHNPVPIGVPGELYIGGVNLARGYLKRPDLTKACFIPNPFQKPGSDRLYKSGDKARFREDGTIEYLGRLDNQVKIRGFRVEMGEIEHHISTYAGIKECGVIDSRKTKNTVLLVAYITLEKDADFDRNALKQYLNRFLPEYMIPSFFILLEELPINRHGKLDRKKLPGPQIDRSQISSFYKSPSTDDEITLANIWKDVLNIENVGVHDDFFDLGGDSILSIRIISKAKEKNITFQLPELFELRTISKVLDRIKKGRDHKKTETKPLKPFDLINEDDRRKIPSGIEDAYPASVLQSGMLYHSEFELSGENLYLIIFSFHLKIPLNIEKFKQALRLLIQRYSAFRTSFNMSTYSTMMQLVHKEVDIPLEVYDISNHSNKEQEKIIEQMLEDEKKRKLDLKEPPLIKFFVHIRSKESFQFTFNESHAILDGWSDTLMLRDIFMDYVSLLKHGQPAGLPDLKIDYRDFVALELEAMNSDRQKQFWTKKVAQTNYLKLPSLPVKEKEVSKWGEIVYPIPKGVLAGAKELATKAQVPIKSVFLSAHYKLLQSYTHEKVLTTGLVVNGRPEAIDGEKVPGLFLNTLPVTVEMREENWFEFLKKVFEAELEIWDYRRFPLAKLKGDKKVTELFDVCFNYNHFHKVDDIKGIQEIEYLDLKTSGQTNYPLSASFNRYPNTEQMEIMLWFDPSVFNHQYIENIGQCYVQILQQMIDNPETPCVRTSVLPKNQFDQIIRQGTGPSTEYDTSLLPYQSFEKIAAEKPNNPAVVFGNEHITYGELNQRVNKFCHYLIAKGVKPEDMVVISVPRSINFILCTLGIAKAGAVFVPVDPALPEKRISYILEDTKAVFMVVDDRKNYQFICDKHPTIDLTTDNHQIFEEDGHNPPVKVTLSDRIYVIYTSGSTGKPKGVQITHGNLLNLVTWHVDHFGIAEQDRACQLSNVSFDASVWEIWPHLVAGATLYVAPSDVIGNPKGMKQWVIENAITRLFLTTTLAEDFILQKWDNNDDIKLKTLLCGGERATCFTPESLPFKLVNAYGPTENTVIATTGEIPLQSDAVTTYPTIGTSACYSQLYILDEYLQPVPIGVPGELCISGRSLSPGYLARPGLNAQKFVDHPFLPNGKLYLTGDLCRWLPNDEIEFIERKDNQVKINGFRIELGEVQNLLEQHPHVTNAIVLSKKEKNGRKHLVGFLQYDHDQLFNHKNQPKFLDALYDDVSAINGDASFNNGTFNSTHKPTSEDDAKSHNTQPIHSQILKQFTQDVETQFKTKAPHFMVPSALIPVNDLPLNANGKVDREALLVLADLQAKSIKKSTKPPKSEIETKLLSIWQKALDLKRISVDENFFDVGGDSLLALRILAIIQEEFGFQIPISALVEAPTIELLAQKIISYDPENIWDLMVCVKKEGDRTPLFCVPGNGGNVLIFHWFARYLNYGPIYAFQTRGLDGVTEPYPTLEEMADDFLREVKKVQPSGPYMFAGHSYGCKVIFEMMQILKRQNEDVQLLLMFDTPDTILSDAPQGQDWGIERWMCDVARRFNLFLPKLMKIKVSHDHLKSLSTKEQMTLFRDILIKCGVLKGDAHINHIKGFLNVFAHGLKIDYRPQTHHQADKIILFKAKSRRDNLYYESVEDPKEIESINHTLNKDQTWGWDKYSKEPVSVFNVPGNHGTLLVPPYVHSITKKLNRYFGRPDNKNHNFLQKIKDVYDVFIKNA